MREGPFQLIVSIIMIVMVFTLIPVSFCQGQCYAKAVTGTCQGAGGAMAPLAFTHAALSNPQAGIPFPNPHSNPVQMVPGFHCPCVLPMPPERVEFPRTFGVSKLLFFEPFKAIPEVFLAKFIPPA